MSEVRGHDHAACRAAALEAATRLTESRGLKLTPTRARVLEIVAESHKPVGAYDILQRLAGERGRAAPPTVYRALAFLVEQGLVHRIDSLNAYVGCPQPGRPHAAYFFICRDCGDAAELHDDELSASLAACARRAGFQVETATVELAGICARCSGRPS